MTRFDFEQRWSEGHRAGRVHAFERSRILAGDISPIIRELKPEFEDEQEIVLSWSRSTPQAMRDPYGSLKLTGEVVRPKSEPLFTITIRDVKRHKAGYFNVRFHVLDRRERLRLVRRNLPSRRDGEYSEATEEEAAEAVEESAYTPNPEQALDRDEAVPADVQDVLSMQAHSRFAEHKRAEHADEEAAQDLLRLNSELRELVKRAAKMGLSPTQVLAPIAREISEQHANLKDAA